MKQFQIRKDAFATHRIQEAESPSLSPGQVRLRVRRFALTANNLTYAATGDTLGYWRFFPPIGDDVDGWGVIPVWGFAEVSESSHDDVPVGERVFGYFPPATELVMTPSKINPQIIVDGSEHRARLPAPYNTYQRVGAEAPDMKSIEDERALLYPLHITAYCLADAIREAKWHGAKQVLVLSASSKTSIGLAYALQADDEAPRSIGVTSSANLDFVDRLGLYDASLTYDTLDRLEPDVPTLVVDMSGNTKVLAQLVGHLGQALKFCVRVGMTHWDHAGDVDLPSDRQEFFFAPAQAMKRSKELGRAEFDALSQAFIRDAATKSRDWLRVTELAGLEAVAEVYPRLCAGKVAPDQGMIGVL
ncbi:MAG: DUF2855 family protein [Myxococcota bacterium]